MLQKRCAIREVHMRQKGLVWWPKTFLATLAIWPVFWPL
nr:MAG TPA: hypothetical protein [Caudoviricetes sp.]